MKDQLVLNSLLNRIATLELEKANLLAELTLLKQKEVEENGDNTRIQER